MRFSDLLHPERVVGLAAKVFGWLLALLLALELFRNLAAQARLSEREIALVMLALLATSPIAYLIRERRQKPKRRAPRRGAERRPVLPPNGGEE